jgi:hypothetical protein
MLQNNSIFTANTVQTSQQPAQLHKRHRKKIAIVIAAILIVVLGVAFFIPHGVATIPLTANYTVGEVLVYSNNITSTARFDISSQGSTSTGIENETLFIKDFDRSYFTIVHNISLTMSFEFGQSSPLVYSFTNKMSKTGFAIYGLRFDGSQVNVPNNNGAGGDSFLTPMINQSQVKVGDKISIPYPERSSLGLEITGNLEITFGDVQDLTVPAGTFRVFKINIEGANLETKQILNDTSIPDITGSLNIHHEIYLEYGTLKVVKASTQWDSRVDPDTFTSFIISTECSLINDTKA